MRGHAFQRDGHALLMFSEADGVEFRYFSQAPDKYFWFMGCANGTTQSWDGCSLRFIDLLIPDNRPGQTEKINLSGLPWHLIATDLKKITGMTFDDPSMKYIWQGPGRCIGIIFFFLIPSICAACENFLSVQTYIVHSQTTLK